MAEPSKLQKVQTESLRMLIARASSYELTEITRRMIDEWDKWPIGVFFDLKHKILAGFPMPEDLHADLVVLSKSLTLYQARNFNNQSWLKFLKEGIPDKDIELKLAEYVAGEIINNRYGSIKECLKTLRDYGSIASLKFLEVAAYETYSDTQVHKISISLFGESSTSDALPMDFDAWSKKMVSTINVQLADLLKDTIDEIRIRNASHDFRWCDWSTL
jgi:hypothetical protein